MFSAGVKAAIGLSIIGAIVLNFAGLVDDPVRRGIAFGILSVLYVWSCRLIDRYFPAKHNPRGQSESVIIYGAGASGAHLANSLSGNLDLHPVAMIDDDPTLIGKTVAGLKIHSPSTIDRLIRDTRATRVLLAMPGASRTTRRQVLERLARFPVHVQTVPHERDLVSGKAKFDAIYEVDVKDLLDRDYVPPNPELMRSSISGKSVLVTGAGGSIGSELCRQILRLEPARLVLLEISEVALYRVERELRHGAAAMGSDCEIVALLGSVTIEDRLREAMATFQINTVFHAAAYKHVPIVEHNLLVGISNNVFGTLHTVRAAVDCGVENLVLISTDKAVNPTSVMGASKRCAELILQALNEQDGKTRACVVRFGNVLDSSGSVVPLFREQIRNGGPVTVTHPEISRYFMTITEAAELVIQAAALARGGDVFVLDMGQPVRINELAEWMIKLHGLTIRSKKNPDGDIEVHYVGLRPAEKLFEELYIGSDVSGTEHPRILRANKEFTPMDTLLTLLEELRLATDSQDYVSARRTLLKIVPEYDPENGIGDLVWSSKTCTMRAEDADTIVEFPARKG